MFDKETVERAARAIASEDGDLYDHCGPSTQSHYKALATAALAAAWEWKPPEEAKPGEKYLVLEEDGEMNVAYIMENERCSWWKTNCNCGGDGDSTIQPVFCAKLPAAPEVKP